MSCLSISNAMLPYTISFFFFFFSFFTIYEQLMICLLGQLEYYSSEKVQYRHAGTRIFNGIAFCSIWPRNNLQVPYHQWHKKTLSFPYESLSPPLTVSHFAHLNPKLLFALWVMLRGREKQTIIAQKLC